LRRQLLLAVLGLAACGFAPAPFPKPERQRPEDQGDLGGVWRVVRWERNGEREEEIEKGAQVEIARGKFLILGLSGKEREEVDLQIDPKAKPPSLSLSRGTAALAGSYRLQKDHVRVILNRDEKKDVRPTDFAGPCYLRLEMRRIRR
jgi:uncharacterized protein (TIGR03067 family)